MKWYFYILLGYVVGILDTQLLTLLPLQYVSLGVIGMLIGLRRASDFKSLVAFSTALLIVEYLSLPLYGFALWFVAYGVILTAASIHSTATSISEYRVACVILVAWHVAWLMYWVVTRGAAPLFFINAFIACVGSLLLYSVGFLVAHHEDKIVFS